jgi:hypothetical protein
MKQKPEERRFEVEFEYVIRPEANGKISGWQKQN